MVPFYHLGYGFERPSVIQQKAILPLIKGIDTIAQAQSGTGKTGAFSIGVLHRIDPLSSYTQALIIAPTRELAKQIKDVILSKSRLSRVWEPFPRSTATCAPEEQQFLKTEKNYQKIATSSSEHLEEFSI